MPDSTASSADTKALACATTLSTGRLRDLTGKYSIRINDQWRVCFVWAGDGVYDVEIIDYH